MTAGPPCTTIDHSVVLLSELHSPSEQSPTSRLRVIKSLLIYKNDLPESILCILKLKGASYAVVSDPGCSMQHSLQPCKTLSAATPTWLEHPILTTVVSESS